MMPVSRRVEATVSPAAAGSDRRSPNSSTVAVVVATSFVLLSALASLLGGTDAPRRPETAAALGLRGSLPAIVEPPPS